jgi:hypothetical protein
VLQFNFANLPSRNNSHPSMRMPTCASVLHEPLRSRLIQVVREYRELRLKIADSSHPDAKFREALHRFRTMQTEVTELVAQAMKKEDLALRGSLLNVLNRLQNSHAVRIAAVKERLPSEIIVLIFVSAILSEILVGREQGVAGRVELGGTAGFILVLVLAVPVILDLNHATRGLVSVSQDPFRELICLSAPSIYASEREAPWAIPRTHRS